MLLKQHPRTCRKKHKSRAKTYQIDPASNKLLGFSQTMTQTGGATSTANVAYSFDANGALLSDGLRHYAYDSEGRLAAASLGWSNTATTDDSITKYAHNSQSQRVFKTAPLYAVTNPQEAAPLSIWTIFTNFFESLWSPSTGTAAAAQKSGMSYVYDEEGSLIAETLTGGASSSWGQSAKYIQLPTASGPMPVAVVYGSGAAAKHYAIQSDHLNTPRRLIQSDGQVAWQWAYSAFGDEKPTIAKTRFANADLNQSFGSTTVPAVTFNLRYPGQYYDQESNLHYNYHRSYSATVGRYTQSDPIGLDGGWNMYAYVNGAPTMFTDPEGLQSLVTDSRAGTTTFNPYPYPGAPFSIPTSTSTARSARPDANGGFQTPNVVGIRKKGDTPEFGPDGTVIDVGDSRGRHIHGGGSCAKDPLADRQGWCVTLGCTRGQNEDVQALWQRIKDFKTQNPKIKIPYYRY